MITEEKSVIVITDESPCPPGIHAAHVRHRTLPVVSGEGETAWEAAEDLVRKLIRETSSVVGWHRTELERVISDIREFMFRGPSRLVH